MNAKEIIKNKFWIVEDHGERVGTLSLRDDQYMLSNSNGTRFFADEKQLERSFKANINWTDLEITETISNEVNNE